MENNNKIKKIIISIIVLILVLSIGSVYAFFTYSETGNKNNQLIIGNVYLDLHEIDGINITNFEPQEERPNDYYEFEVKGTNESDKDVIYDINVLHGNDSTNEGAIRVADKFVSFTLMKEVSNNNWETVIDKEIYSDLSEPVRIYVDRFDANTTEETSQKYRLYAWINRDMEVYAGSLTSNDGDYSIEEYNKLYASIKVKVTGDFKEKGYEIPIHTVTFDYNDGETESTTKRVVYHGHYGTLPEPTRDGYTFMGWNGKNMFSELIKGVGINDSNGYERLRNDFSVSNYISVTINSNNTYYFLDGLSLELYSCIYAYNENKEYIGRTIGTNRAKIIINKSSFVNNITEVTGDIKYIRIMQMENINLNGKIDDIDNLKIQLEEGDTATEYEPYYITSNTKVVQDKDHTLKAIWKENE